ncbi:uncharacterized protein LOC134196617 isoform X2 [Corticium candelabrum]|uniref:uncharacterized protein LOC134196617 isoform X2 n=1 Tax=Corticium candelabrum TaxID=121492 RepID=UPI002E266FF7|nr:uncharacterized protein LOC134196617 isoform X2 [Corticium candelabrum]
MMVSIATCLFFTLTICGVGYGRNYISDSDGECNSAYCSCGPYRLRMKKRSTSELVNVSSLFDRKVRSGNTTLTIVMNSTSAHISWLGMFFYPFGHNPEEPSNACNYIVASTDAAAGIEVCKVVTLKEACEVANRKQGDCRPFDESAVNTHFNADCQKNGSRVDIRISTCQHTVSGSDSGYESPFNVNWWPFYEGRLYAAIVGGNNKLTGSHLYNCPAYSSNYTDIEVISHDLGKWQSELLNMVVI